MIDKVPKASHALVDQRKIVEYLLSSEHPVGKNKARVFARCGYGREHVEQIIAELKIHVQNGQVVDVIDSPYGVKYCVEGFIRCTGIANL